MLFHLTWSILFKMLAWETLLSHSHWIKFLKSQSETFILRFSKPKLWTKWITPQERAWRPVPKNGVIVLIFVCSHFSLWKDVLYVLFAFHSICPGFNSQGYTGHQLDTAYPWELMCDSSKLMQRLFHVSKSILQLLMLKIFSWGEDIIDLLKEKPILQGYQFIDVSATIFWHPAIMS